MGVDGDVADDDGEREFLRHGIAREEIGRGFGVRNRVVYECDETIPRDAPGRLRRTMVW